MGIGLDSGAVTALLQRWNQDEPEALGKLLPLVYDDLRAIARSYMCHERQGHTLGATGLVHEAFLRLAGRAPETWQNRKHFYGIAARLMRQVLVDYARYHAARKRDAGLAAPDLPPLAAGQRELNADYLLLDRCLSQLELTNERRAEIVELRFFGGLTVNEIAEAKDLSPSMVKKELTIAKVWLFQQIQGEGGGPRMQPEG